LSATREPKLKVVNMPWDDPCGKIDFLVEWMNYTRQFVSFDHQMYLDADELLDPASGPLLREIPAGGARVFHRLNFWLNGRTLIPHGRTCSHLVVRYGPSKMRATSDEIYGKDNFPGPEPEIRGIALKDERLRIFHYGFLRKQAAMIAKCKVVLRAFFNTYDTRLVEAEKHPDRMWQEFAHYDDLPLPKFHGEHPPFAIEWLKERGAL
jgi:hypothetical protein